MLDKALQFTSSILNQYLRNNYGLSDDVVTINNVITPSGDIPEENKNKIVISLLNIEQETNKQFYGRMQPLPSGNYADINPSDRYNLDVLFSANFQNYSETLKFLNGTLQFFQANNSIDRVRYSSMPKGINRLDYDVEKLTYHQMHSLWSAMGAKYQPSVIYKLRLIHIQNGEALSIVTSVNEASNKTNLV
jgi:hypothetical protein